MESSRNSRRGASVRTADSFNQQPPRMESAASRFWGKDELRSLVLEQLYNHQYHRLLSLDKSTFPSVVAAMYRTVNVYNLKKIIKFQKRKTKTKAEKARAAAYSEAVQNCWADHSDGIVKFDTWQSLVELFPNIKRIVWFRAETRFHVSPEGVRYPSHSTIHIHPDIDYIGPFLPLNNAMYPSLVDSVTLDYNIRLGTRRYWFDKNLDTPLLPPAKGLSPYLTLPMNRLEIEDISLDNFARILDLRRDAGFLPIKELRVFCDVSTQGLNALLRASSGMLVRCSINGSHPYEGCPLDVERRERSFVTEGIDRNIWVRSMIRDKVRHTGVPIQDIWSKIDWDCIKGLKCLSMNSIISLESTSEDFPTILQPEVPVNCIHLDEFHLDFLVLLTDMTHKMLRKHSVDNHIQFPMARELAEFLLEIAGPNCKFSFSFDGKISGRVRSMDSGRGGRGDNEDIDNLDWLCWSSDVQTEIQKIKGGPGNVTRTKKKTILLRDLYEGDERMEGVEHPTS